jgi:hypothetical protein
VQPANEKTYPNFPDVFEMKSIPYKFYPLFHNHRDNHGDFCTQIPGMVPSEKASPQTAHNSLI